MGNKIYYDCPGCGNEVWAYKGFVGTKCWDCPGTILSGIGHVTHVSTVVDTVTNTKTWYTCNGCGSKVWAYGGFSGQDCWNCKGKNPIKAVLDIGVGIVPGGSSTFELSKDIYKTVNPLEFLNSKGCVVQGDGGHHIKVSKYINAKAVKMYVRKSDLLYKPLNTVGSTLRFIIAPVSTLDSNTFWTEHWWVVFELDNGEYITTYKQKWGVYVYKLNYWSTANSNTYNGMGSYKNKSPKTVKSCTGTRSVTEIIKKIESMDSYYNLSTKNCQHYANKLYWWY